YERAIDQLLRVSTSLVGRPGELEQLLQAICEGISSALGFQRVSVALVDPSVGSFTTRAATGLAIDEPVFRTGYGLSDIQPLLDPAFEIAGCFLLTSVAASERVGADFAMYASRNNGRGPKAWSRHWLLVPPLDAAG